ncbi:hypothetical protein Q5P01_002285 [Channa striata]|uniref:Serpin domain-containing protein n=1 Tax=Channa striata TaxID=64152 RepID=A0AA88NQ78_CHASR|nr:hypothetical protein Q5P01_002285 [Channa striata]
MKSRSAMLPRLAVSFLMLSSVLPVLGSTTSSPENSSVTPAGSPPRPPSPLGDLTWTLGLRLYRAVRSEPSSVNAVFSPLLVASSLGALGGGSAGTTAGQVQDLLKTPVSSKAKAQVGGLLSAALKSFTDANGTAFHLHTSSAMFSKQAPPVSKSFVKDSQAKFRLQHQPMGKGDAKADLKQLRAWAKAGLGGLDGAPVEGEIKANAGALILASALRFKGLWEKEFSQESTDRRTFLGVKYTKVMMMHRAGLYRFHEDMENMVQVLEAPLLGNKASLVLLLPFHVENLDRVEKLLNPEQLSKWLEKTSRTSVSISLPRANISSTLSLQKPLSALGLTDAWDQKVADFSGVSDKSKGKLHLGGVFHWASLELAAEAGKGTVEEENIQKPKLFYADHPFIIFVRDSATGALLLMGAVDHLEGEPLHDEL